MSPRGASGVGRPAVLDGEKGTANEQARETAIKANAAMKTWFLFETPGKFLDIIIHARFWRDCGKGNALNYDTNCPNYCGYSTISAE
jgi:hypothetical protein